MRHLRYCRLTDSTILSVISGFRPALQSDFALSPIILTFRETQPKCIGYAVIELLAHAGRLGEDDFHRIFIG